jgi:hypothetical protein
MTPQFSTLIHLLFAGGLSFFLVGLGHGFFVYPDGYARAYKEYSYQNSPAGKRLLLLQPLLAMQSEYFFTNQKLNANPQDISSGFLAAFEEVRKFPEQYQLKSETLVLLQEAQQQLIELQKHPELFNDESLKTASPWIRFRELIQKIQMSAELK